MSYAIHNNKLALQELDDIKRHINMLYEESIGLKQDNIRLNNIIKEAREYIEKHTLKGDGMLIGVMNNHTKKELLEILDKGE